MSTAWRVVRYAAIAPVFLAAVAVFVVIIVLTGGRGCIAEDDDG